MVQELTPYTIRVPDLFEITFGRGAICTVAQAMQKHERRDAFVRRAMYEHALVCARVEHAREPVKVRRLRRVELHRDVDISHALRGDQFAFVGEGVVRRGQREVNDNVEARLPQRGKIACLRHAARGQAIINAQEVADVV